LDTKQKAIKSIYTNKLKQQESPLKCKFEIEKKRSLTHDL